MKKKIKKDLYSAVAIAAALTIILLAGFVVGGDKRWGIGFTWSFTLTGFLLSIQMVLGDTKIENRSGEPVPVKPEDDSTPLTVEPGAVIYGIDGVRTPQGRVYKVCDGCHAVVHDDGRVSVRSLTGRFINSVRGGYLDSAPDKGWDQLFEA